MKLSDLMEERLKDIKIKKSRLYYRRNYYYFQALLSHFGDQDVSRITKAQMASFLQAIALSARDNERTNAGVNYALRCYKALFNYGLKVFELDFKNPCTGLEPYSTDRKIKFVPTDRQIGAVKELFDGEECLLFNFVMETGARINEALRLKPKDVFDGYVVLYTRKSRYSNLIPRKVPSVTLKNFAGFSRWTAQPRFLEKAVRTANQPVWGWHSLRHRFASKLSRQNVPIFEISQLLGHSSITTTQIYLQMLAGN
jgi:integrase